MLTILIISVIGTGSLADVFGHTLKTTEIISFHFQYPLFYH